MWWSGGKCRNYQNIVRNWFCLIRRRNASNYHSLLRRQTLLKNVLQSWDTLSVNKHLSSFPDRFVLRRRHTMPQPQHTMSQPQHTMSQHQHTMLLILSTLHLCSLPMLHSLDKLLLRTYLWFWYFIYCIIYLNSNKDKLAWDFHWYIGKINHFWNDQRTFPWLEAP